MKRARNCRHCEFLQREAWAAGALQAQLAVADAKVWKTGGPPLWWGLARALFKSLVFASISLALPCSPHCLKNSRKTAVKMSFPDSRWIYGRGPFQWLEFCDKFQLPFLELLLGHVRIEKQKLFSSFFLSCGRFRPEKSINKNKHLNVCHGFFPSNAL